MFKCAACSDPEGGWAHTCAGSGTFIAAEAHVEGEVDEVEVWPRFDVGLSFEVAALDDDGVRVRLNQLIALLLDDDQVDKVEFTIRPRERVA